MPHTFDQLVLGDADPAVIIGPLDTPLAFGQRERLVSTGTLAVGASGAIVACGAARPGLHVAFAGRVGDDDADRHLRDGLAAHGADTGALTFAPGPATPLSVALPHGTDRAVLSAPGTRAATGADEVPPALLSTRAHGGPAAQPTWDEALTRLPETEETPA